MHLDAYSGASSRDSRSREGAGKGSERRQGCATVAGRGASLGSVKGGLEAD